MEKIDSKYEKDIEKRVRNSPILAAWMLGMAVYTTVLRDIPEGIDKIKQNLDFSDIDER